MSRAVLVLLLLGVLVAAGFVGTRLYLDRAAPTGTTTVFVGGQKLAIDRAMIRDPGLRAGGAVNRLDLALVWPSFTGIAARREADKTQDLVFIGLEDAAARNQTAGDIDPAERPAELYARFLAREAWTNPGGLVMRRFRAGTPYEGEELYVSTPDDRQFSARCPTAGSAGALADEPCLWQVRINGLDVQVRFSTRLLSRWNELAGGVRRLAARLRTG